MKEFNADDVQFSEEEMFSMEAEAADEFLDDDSDDNLEIDVLLGKKYDAHVGIRMSAVMDRFHSIY